MTGYQYCIALNLLKVLCYETYSHSPDFSDLKSASIAFIVLMESSGVLGIASPVSRDVSYLNSSFGISSSDKCCAF